MDCKVVIMYRTAKLAFNKNKEIGGVSHKYIKIIDDFNDGTHIVDEDNEQNSYSVL